jgi:hypothetical protein
MSFGFGIGDLALVIKAIADFWSGYKNGPDTYETMRRKQLVAQALFGYHDTNPNDSRAASIASDFSPLQRKVLDDEISHEQKTRKAERDDLERYKGLEKRNFRGFFKRIRFVFKNHSPFRQDMMLDMMFQMSYKMFQMSYKIQKIS